MAFATSTGDRVEAAIACVLVTVAALPVLVRGIRAARRGLPVRAAMRQAMRELGPAIRAMAGLVGSGCVIAVALGVIIVIGIAFAYSVLGGAIFGALFGQKVSTQPTHGESVALTIAGIVLTVAVVIGFGFLLRSMYLLTKTAVAQVAPPATDAAEAATPGPPRNDIAAVGLVHPRRYRNGLTPICPDPGAKTGFLA